MSESEGLTPVLERTRPASSQDQLVIHVCRFGRPERKTLRFSVEDFDITDKQYDYNIKHVIGLERVVESVEVDSEHGKIIVTLHDWQLITEAVAVKLAKSIGNALGFVHGAIIVTSDRLS